MVINLVQEILIIGRGVKYLAPIVPPVVYMIQVTLFEFHKIAVYYVNQGFLKIYPVC
jgi:hypothetical protein